MFPQGSEATGDDQRAATGFKFLGGDLHEVIKDDIEVQSVHDAVATFDPATEEAFSYLQVCTQT